MVHLTETAPTPTREHNIPLSHGLTLHYPATTDAGDRKFIIRNSENNQPWWDLDTDLLTPQIVYAIATARALLESRFSSDLWTNIHFADDGTVTVLGKNPTSETWGQSPRKLDEAPQPPLNQEEATFLTRYLAYWSKLAETIKPFSEQLKPLDPGSEEFSSFAEKRNVVPEVEKAGAMRRKVLWASDRYFVALRESFTSEGVYIEVVPKETLPRLSNEDDIQTVVDLFTIALNVKKILSQDPELQFQTWTIQMNGNWAQDLVDSKNGLDSDSWENNQSMRKNLKRAHRPGNVTETGEPKPTALKTKTSIAIFASKDSAPIVGPSRPPSSAPREWVGVKNLSESDQNRIAKLIHAQLSGEMA